MKGARVLPKQDRYRAEDFCRLGFLFSDLITIVSALVAAYYARFDVLAWLLPPESFFAPSGEIQIKDYAGSILLGAALLIVILFLNGAYENWTLLRFRRFFFLLCKSLLTWLIAFAGILLILEFNERLSRVYVLISLWLAPGFFSRLALRRATDFILDGYRFNTPTTHFVRRLD